MAQLHWRNSAIAPNQDAQPWEYGRRGPLSLLTLELRIPGSVRSPAIGAPSRSAYLPWSVKYVVQDGLWAPLPLAPCSTKWLVQLLREKSGHASKNLVGRLRSRVVHSARPSGSNASGLECVRSLSNGMGASIPLHTPQHPIKDPEAKSSSACVPVRTMRNDHRRVNRQRRTGVAKITASSFFGSVAIAR
jgi:hypothetical protein